MSDVPHVFGEAENLLGVYTPAMQTTGELIPTGVVMVTPGMLHHVGPFRLHVDLARELAEEGLPSFRFCLSGIGESLGIGSEATSLERAVAETRQAMDLLEATYGIKQFILFGLCSGADDSVQVALADRRVIGLALLDGCGFRTSRFYLEKLRSAIPRKLRQWGRVSQRRRNRLEAKIPVASTLPVGDDVREFPTQEVAEDQLLQLNRQAVELFFLYTGGVGQYYNYRDQFADMFPRLRHCPKVQWRYFGDMDHVLRLSEDRQAIVGQLTHWMSMVYLGTGRTQASEVLPVGT